jgi:hypothetical protein
VKRLAIFVHRWLGVVLCAAFLLWFPSGIGMMYWGYPSVTPDDVLEHAAALEPSSVRLSPAEAYATLGLDGPAASVRLNTFDGRPAYRFGVFGGEATVYADSGEQQIDVSRAMADRLAAAWTGLPAGDATVTPVDEVDQWTLQLPLASLSPVWKYSWPRGDHVYVSQAIGEVVQSTTSASRLGAYLGPIPHWFYFTPLRRHPRWSQVVIWSSGIGSVSALLGLIVGFWMYSPRKAYRYDGEPARLPYRGQKRWHAVFGLIFGAGAVTWAFSGMLSMDPFPTRTGGGSEARGAAHEAVGAAFEGEVRIDAYAARHPRAALERLGRPVKELELTSFDGEPIYLARLGKGDTQIVPMNGPPRAAFDHEAIVAVVTRAAGPGMLADVRVLRQYDAYYLDRRRLKPLPVVAATLNDPDGTRYYIDPRTARIVGSYDSRGWVTRWVYHGLHSLDFPWLYTYRPLWDIVVITFMLGGTALGVTSLVLAWRVVGKTLGGRV